MSVPHGEISRDEEGGFPPLPREIRLDGNGTHQMSRLGDDENATASELSTLLSPTPTYDPDLHLGFLGFSLMSRDSADGIGRARRAFQLAALMGFLFMGIIFGADLVFMHDNNASRMDVLSDARHGQEKGHKAKARKKALKQENEHDNQEGDGVISEDAHVAAPENMVAALHTNINMMPEEPQVATPHMISTIIDEWNSSANSDFPIPEAHRRCLYVIGTFQEQNNAVTDMGLLHEKYTAQSVDPNVFYRATARLFWKDFGAGHWGRLQNKSINLQDLVLLGDATYVDGTPLSPKSTETWVTGDQVNIESEFCQLLIF